MKRNFPFQKKSEAQRILEHTTNNIAFLFFWIERHLAKDEVIHVHEWYSDKGCSLWYVEVYDTREGWENGVERMRIGFTIDITKDIILWSKNIIPGMSHTGNCYVRTAKWKKLLKERYGSRILNKVNWYKNRYLPKEK